MRADINGYRRTASATRQFVTLIFILILLAATVEMRFWPVTPVHAQEAVPTFTWRMQPRHTGLSLVNPNDLATARAHVHPTNGYGVTFDGCEANTAEIESITHTYTITGGSLSEPKVLARTARPAVIPPKLGGGLDPPDCADLRIDAGLQQGSYSVRLKVESESIGVAESIAQPVLVKDILIISVGDSYGSGEGTPDQAIQYGLFGLQTAPVVWQDEACHRSAWAGPSQAAAILERSDSHTSVTFISLACSGATINTPIHDSELGFKGAGLLSPYAGIWPKEKDPDPATFLPSQMEQAARIADDRAIDTLMVSGGGNDMHFATVIADCVTSNCSTNQVTADRMADDFTQLPIRYQELAGFIENERDTSDVPALDITPDRVFITEYPNPTRNTNGDWCETGSLDDPLLSLPGTGITRFEMEWASQFVVEPLNQAIEANAALHGWNYVSGIAAEFYGDPANGIPGRGWCALGEDQYGVPNNWINRSPQALTSQGPVTLPMGLIFVAGAWGFVSLLPLGSFAIWAAIVAGGALLAELKGTDGTMHPNRMGQMVYARHIASAIQSRLNGGLPQPGDTTPPTIAPAQNITVETLDAAGAVIDYPAPATNDNIDGAGLASCAPVSGSLFPIGTTAVTCSAADASGNQAAPVAFNVTVDAIVVPAPPMPDGAAYVQSWCNNGGDTIDRVDGPAPLTFAGVNTDAISSGQGLKAKVALADDYCSVETGHVIGVTVEPGSSGLQPGDAVLVQLRFELDGTFEIAPREIGATAGGMDAHYQLYDRERDGCSYEFCEPIVSFSATARAGQRAAWDAFSTLSSAEWTLSQEGSVIGHEYAELNCFEACVVPATFPFATGAQTVIVPTTVGARLEVDTWLALYGGSDDGSITVDFFNTFSAGAFQPAPGYEGLSFVYDVPAESNQPPAVDAGGPYSVDEGGSIALTATGSDPEGGQLTYAWDLDGDGAFETDGSNPTLSVADGPTSLAVAVRATDDAGNTADASTTIEVHNVAPVIDAGSAQTIFEGGPFATTGSFSDAGTLDTHTASVNYGDGSPVATIAPNPDMTVALQHTYTTAGAFTITVCVADDDGGQGCDTLAVSVTPYAIFAGRDDCGSGSADAIQWSGSNGVLHGDLHSNSGLQVSGSKNTANGSASYRCQVKVSGSKNTFTSGPSKVVDSRPWPVQVDATAFACDITVAGKLDLSKDGVWWVGGKANSRQLAPVTICAGEITLSGSNISGTVTLVAGKIELSGSNLRLAAHQHGVIAFASGSGNDVVKVSGSNTRLTGDLVARSGQVSLSGSNDRVTGAVIGWTVKLSGSNWTIDARVTE